MIESTQIRSLARNVRMPAGDQAARLRRVGRSESSIASASLSASRSFKVLIVTRTALAL
jgi:hypothetical protein